MKQQQAAAVPLRLAAPSSTRLQGRRLIIARAAWIGVAVLALLVFAAGVPATFHEALTISAETRADLAKFGLSERFPAYFFITTDILTILSFSGIAWVLFWLRSDDWMVMFVGWMLLLTGIIYTHPVANAPVSVWIIAGLIGLGEICQVAFFYLFPDGRCVPRWSRWLFPPMFVWRPAIWALVYLPNARALHASAENYGSVPQDSTDISLMIGLFALGIASQVYRYRRVSSRMQRQQVKWLLFGMAITVTVVGTYVVAVNVLHIFGRLGQSSFFLLAATRSMRQIALLVVPAAIMISILRYRLWDIDILINRALVYGVLTAMLALVYFGSVVVLQQLFRRLTGQTSQLAVVASTLAIAALFQPLRWRIQDFIDRRFYRRKYDAARTLEAFSARLRQEVDLETLTADLLAVVEETMEPAHVSLWLRPSEHQE